MFHVERFWYGSDNRVMMICTPYLTSWENTGKHPSTLKMENFELLAYILEL